MRLVYRRILLVLKESLKNIKELIVNVLNNIPLKITIDMIGVKLGGCGINLEKTRIKINRIG